MSKTRIPDKYEDLSSVGSGALEINTSEAARFAAMIKAAGNTDISACYQCRKCSSGCPVAYAMDYTPTQILHAARLGLKDLVMNSSAIWLCAACETCVVRCPQGVDIVRTMDTLRAMCLSDGYKPKLPEIANFYKYTLGNIQAFGRLYELGLMGRLKLATRQFTKDVSLGVTMLRKGKLKIIPDMGGIREMRRTEFRVVKRKK